MADNNPVATGDVPTVLITSPGVQAGMGQTAPNIVQGQRYTVGQSISLPANNATNATQYKLASLTWSYPQSAVQGYGRFSTTNGVTKFTGSPNSNPNTSVSVQTFAGPQTYNPAIQPNSFIDTFYWGPSAVGLQTISVQANFSVTVNGMLQPNQYSATDNIEVNVLQPTGNITTTTMGTPGPGNYKDAKTLLLYPAFSLAQGTIYTNAGVTNGITGLDLTSVVNQTITNPDNTTTTLGGLSAVAQVVTTANSITYFDPNDRKVKTINSVVKTASPEFGTAPTALDTNFPYVPNYYQVPGVDMETSDTPAQRLDNPTFTLSINRRDNFTTTLFYYPVGGILVPVGSITWGWSFAYKYTPNNMPATTVTYTRTPAVGGGFPTYSAATANANFLTWNHNITEFGYQ